MVVCFLRQALRNLENIHAYYATRPNPAHAYEVIADMREQINRLAQYPAYGRPGKRMGTRELVIRRYPYIAVYRVVGEQVVIIRVHHARQQG